MKTKKIKIKFPNPVEIESDADAGSKGLFKKRIKKNCPKITKISKE